MNIRLLTLFIFSYTIILNAQNLEQIGKVPLLRYNGGISANSVFYDGSANRDPFTYFINGNLNFNISGVYNIPLSFSYTNQDFGYSTPFKINRLSIHPSYKWVNTHIGDIAMTFSPYTLSGHQFTGGGVDLTPTGPFKISALYGRFLRASEYNIELPEVLPAYERFGYGLKASYDFKKIAVGLIFFSAKDDQSSLKNEIPVELELTPKENTVISSEISFNLFDKAKIRVEYAISGITENTQTNESRETSGILSFLLDENNTTNYYNALNANLDYPAGNGSVGIGYERIDPDYRTFGAYYFNNDLENITLNANQSIFNNKVNLSVNAGLQRDNLDNTKSSELQRVVSAVNINYTSSDKLSFNGGYSNFQSYTNIQDQFDFINQVNQLENVDTLNYRQISQNANLGINYILKKSESKQKTINLNLTYQSSDNKQDGRTIENGLSRFYNIASAYTLGYPKNALNFSLAANISYNTIGNTDNLTFGPTLTATKSFFDKKLRVNFSSAYNSAFNDGEKQNDIYNIRLGSSYTLRESHNLNLNLLSLFRETEDTNNTDFTATLGYSYSFDTFKINSKKRNKKLLSDADGIITIEETLQFRYKSTTYSGTMLQITEQLTNVKNSSRFQNIPQHGKKEIDFLFEVVKKQNKVNSYKEHALQFLKALYSFEDFLKIYDDIVYQVLETIKKDMQLMDFKLERDYVKTKIALDALKKEVPKNNLKIEESNNKLIDRQKKLIGHRWMKKQFDKYNNIESVKKPDNLIKEFKKNEVENAFKLHLEESDDHKKIKTYLEYQIIDFYYRKSLEEKNKGTLELRYINKI
ncbi:TonB-dependent receptor [Aquimarina algicola]|uniref:Uncharacterized protein n=1 Tax=Aquimarina algicola TaxID=2589995 RepID=A0A504JS85_9FLAO|nr:hypothetical protein [Aquimarina algicola]TPN89250.1 hypothetical protein FHK87_03210 [Aquimarina algicola]